MGSIILNIYLVVKIPWAPSSGDW